MTINLELAKEMGITDENILQIDALHTKRDEYMIKLEDLNEAHKTQISLKTIAKVEDLMGYYGELMTNLERELQKLWGFDTDVRYTRFWNLAGCVCPKMDNEDPLMMGPIYSGACHLHGAVVNREVE